MKIFLFFCLLLLVSWTILEKGLEYECVVTKVPQTIYLLKVNPQQFSIRPEKAYLAQEGRKSVLEMAEEHGAIAAINGGFFRENGTPAGVLKIDDTWYGLPVKPRGAIGWNRKKQRPSFDKLTHEMIPLLNPKKNWEDFDYIVGGTPLLIFSGKKIDDFKPELTIETFLTQRHARTAIGLLKTREWLFLVVDGKQENYSLGMTMDELAAFMYNAGCTAALNLDGGGSSAMFIYDKIVNQPYSNEPEDGGLLRKVSDAILLFKKEV